jgi:MarR family transcriptional regulator for hemolysin
MVVSRMTREMFRVLRKRFEEQGEIKLTIEQFGLLHMINREDDNVIQKTMAEKIGKNKSAVLRLIDSLEEKELVRRASGIKDRRKNYLMVTKKGERVIEQYLKIEFGLVDELQQSLTASDIDVFYKVVNQIRSKAEKL